MIRTEAVGTQWISTRAIAVCICLAAGAVVGAMTALVPLEEAVMLMVGIVGVILAIRYPLQGIYCLMAGLILVLDAKDRTRPEAWPFLDIDVIPGLPSALWVFCLLLFGGLVFRLHILTRKQSALPVAFLWVYGAILVVASLRGLVEGWDSMARRTDLLHFIYPALFAYVCVNVLDTREAIYGALGVVLASGVINACILCGFFFAGQGVAFSLGSGQTASAVVTLDSGSLMVCVAGLLMMLAWIMCGSLSARQTLGVALCALPLLFVVVFSYRRAEWLGLMGGTCALLLIGTWHQRSRLVSALVVCLVALLLCGVVVVQVFGSGEFLASVSTRAETFGSSEHSPNQHHLFEPLQAFKDCCRRPFLAMGLGGEHGPIPQFPLDTVPRHVVHNTWIYVWMKLGLAGVVVMVWASVRHVRRIREYLRSAPGGERDPLVMALVAMLPLLFMQLMTGPMLWYPQQMCLVVLFVVLTGNLIKAEGVVLS